MGGVIEGRGRASIVDIRPAGKGASGKLEIKSTVRLVSAKNKSKKRLFGASPLRRFAALHNIPCLHKNPVICTKIECRPQ